MSKIIKKYRRYDGVYDEDLLVELLRSTTIKVCGIYNRSFTSIDERDLSFVVFLKNEDPRYGHVWNATTYWVHVYIDGSAQIHTSTYMALSR